MRDLLDKLELKFKDKESVIESQEKMIEELKRECQTLRSENAMKEGQIVELNSKWNKVQKMIKEGFK